MSYASRFFQSVGATSVHASAARLTSIANAVNGRKALRHAFESARYGAMGFSYNRKLAQKITADAQRNLDEMEEKLSALDCQRTVDGVSEGASYMPKRRNQHSKPYTVIAFMAGTRDVMFHRGNREKVDSMSLGKFIETVKL